MKLNIPTKNNEKLKKIVERVLRDESITEMWNASNITAVDRLGYNDHGETHIAIVANIALKLYRMLEKYVSPGIVLHHKLTEKDGEIVVVLASFFHDLGHIVHREKHAEFSVSLASPLIEKVLNGLYPKKELVRMKADILHAIFSHEKNYRPLTMEAGCVRIADALDMEEGRARIPFSAGKVDIHSVSAMAITNVSIKKGRERPIFIEIEMKNYAGIYQIDELLKNKIKNSGLEKFIEVKAIIGTGSSQTSKTFKF